MENKILKEYLDEFKDDATLHVLVANRQDRKIYAPKELNMIYDEGQTDPVLCIEVGEAQDLDKELVDATMDDERAAQPEFPKLKTMSRGKNFFGLTEIGLFGLKYHRQMKSITDTFFQMIQQLLFASTNCM